MESRTLSVAQRRRLEKLAGDVPASQWIVAPVDPQAHVVTVAGMASRGPLFAAVGPNPVSAIHRLHAAGLRYRAHLAASAAADLPSDWTRPIALLCLPGGEPNLRALLAKWGAHVVAGGHVMFYGDVAPRLAALGLRPGYWTPHLKEGGGLFLLTRRPYG